MLDNRRLRLSLAFAALLQLTGCSSSDTPKGDASPGDAALTDTLNQEMGSVEDSALFNQAPHDVGGADGPELVLLTNEYPCAGDEAKIYPSEGEEGHLIAAKLTPPSYPFTVNSVRYQLEATEKCNNTQAHRVEISWGTENLPKNDPSSEELQTIVVPEVTTAPAQRMVDQPLSTPLTLSAGEHLFVAVQMPKDVDGKQGCLTVCMGNGLEDHTFWSNAPEQPYSWSAFNALDMNVMIMALGYEG